VHVLLSDAATSMQALHSTAQALRCNGAIPRVTEIDLRSSLRTQGSVKWHAPTSIFCGMVTPGWSQTLWFNGERDWVTSMSDLT
jgi:hypothetical protein